MNKILVFVFVLPGCSCNPERPLITLKYWSQMCMLLHDVNLIFKGSIMPGRALFLHFANEIVKEGGILAFGLFVNWICQ